VHASAVYTQTVSASACANVRKHSTRKKIPCGWEDRRKEEEREAGSVHRSSMANARNGHCIGIYPS